MLAAERHTPLMGMLLVDHPAEEQTVSSVPAPSKKGASTRCHHTLLGETHTCMDRHTLIHRHDTHTCVYVYMCICMCLYIYIYMHMHQKHSCGTLSDEKEVLSVLGFAHANLMRDQPSSTRFSYPTSHERESLKPGASLSGPPTRSRYGLTEFALA